MWSSIKWTSLSEAQAGCLTIKWMYIISSAVIRCASGSQSVGNTAASSSSDAATIFIPKTWHHSERRVCVCVCGDGGEGGLWGAFKTANLTPWLHGCSCKGRGHCVFFFFLILFLNYTGEKDVVFFTLRLRASGVTCEGNDELRRGRGKHHGGFYSPYPNVWHSNATPLLCDGQFRPNAIK